MARPDVDGIFLLNPTAEIIWNQQASGFTVAQSAEWFQSSFGLSLAEAQRDIEATLAQWSTGLLTAKTPAKALLLTTKSANPDAFVLNCLLNGKTFRVSLDPGDLIDEIVPRLKPLAASFETPDFNLIVAQADGELPSAARILLLQEMSQLCQPGRVPQAILHSGACGSDSACVLLAGATGSGKSTLCAALMAEGLLCYSDDSAMLDANFDVAGMPFPLMLREGSWPYFPQIQQAPIYDRWGTAVRFLPSNLPGNSSPSVPVRALLFVDYRLGATPSLEPITTFDALLAIQQSGFWIEQQRSTIDAFLRWLGELPKYRFTYSNLAAATAAIADLLK